MQLILLPFSYREMVATFENNFISSPPIDSFTRSFIHSLSLAACCPWRLFFSYALLSRQSIAVVKRREPSTSITPIT